MYRHYIGVERFWFWGLRVGAVRGKLPGAAWACARGAARRGLRGGCAAREGGLCVGGCARGAVHGGLRARGG